MPLPGGPSGKYGIQYETYWTVNCILDVMDEKADMIRLEPPGTEGEGFEFWVQSGDMQSYHQVKRQRGISGKWSISDLGKSGVLTDFLDKLSDPNIECCFVSAVSTEQFGELVDRANRSATFKEFRQEFTKAEHMDKAFDQLLHFWKDRCPEDAYAALNRIETRTCDDLTLKENIHNRIRVLADGEPSTVASVLFMYVQDNVHRFISADDIWAHLEEEGFRRREWSKDPHVLAVVHENNNRFMSEIHESAILGKMIPRSETELAVKEILDGEGKRIVLITGKAGMGKSGVILEVMEELIFKHIPVVALRVDRLEPGAIPEDIGSQLGLPGSPASVLANITHGRPGVLIVDQIDSVSLASGRNPGFFGCINAMIRQSLLHDNIQLMIACREFDFENDARFQRLATNEPGAKKIEVRPLLLEEVKEAILSLGIEVERLNDEQLRLLSVPLHLSLLTQVIEDGLTDVFDFNTSNELYGLFWDQKQRYIQAEINFPLEWTHVIDDLCNYMSNNRTLSAPKIVLDDYARSAEAMASWHVLVMDSGKYSFFHESFFDYAFARRFVSHGEELLEMLESSEQHLFRRAQVRQILLRERLDSFDRYIRNIKEIIESIDIRFHIKQITIALLGEIDEPTEEEWDIIEPLISDSDTPLSKYAWGMLGGSRKWFEFLDAHGLIEQWLNSDNDDIVNDTLWLLSSVKAIELDRVAELFEPCVVKSGEMCDRVIQAVLCQDLGESRKLLNLILSVFETSDNDDRIDSTLWHIIRVLSKNDSDWACEVLARYLDRKLEISLVKEQENPFDRETGTIKHAREDGAILLNIAKDSPNMFVDQLLPFMLKVMDLNARRREEHLWRDPIWGYRFVGRIYDLEDGLLLGMIIALSTLSTINPEEFSTAVNILKNTDFETAHFLLIRAYTESGADFADEAVDYLCEHASRMEIGYASGGDSRYWASRELIAAVSPYCSESSLKSLEERVLNFYPDSEKSIPGYKYSGRGQMVLLEGFPEPLLSITAKKKLAEHHRKFVGKPVSPPEETSGGFVVSPIPESAAARMSDDNWIKAIDLYDYEDMRPREDGQLAGGKDELAQVLENLVVMNPSRFSELIFKLPSETSPSYFSAIMRGIAEESRDVDLIMRVCDFCHKLPGRPCGFAIVDSIGKIADCPIPAKGFKIVGWYATKDADPDKEYWRTEASGDEPYYSGDIRTAGINSVRGRAAEAMALLIHYDGSRIPQVGEFLEDMVKDESIAVRSCVAAVLVQLLRHDETLALDLFKELCYAEDSLLKTPYIERFLLFASKDNLMAVFHIVERMVFSDDSDVAKVGARLVCYVAVDDETARELAEMCIRGNEVQRIGAAEALAVRLKSDSGGYCERLLRGFFNDANNHVRVQASRCFEYIEPDDLERYEELTRSFIESDGFVDNFRTLLKLMNESESVSSELVVLACDRYINGISTVAHDLLARTSEIESVGNLALKMYSRSPDNSTGIACLNLLDQLLEKGTPGLERTMEEFHR